MNKVNQSKVEVEHRKSPKGSFEIIRHLPINGSSAASEVAAARQTKQSNRMVGFSMERSSSISPPRMDVSSDNR
jgi:hypothetical protein